MSASESVFHKMPYSSKGKGIAHLIHLPPITPTSAEVVHEDAICTPSSSYTGTRQAQFIRSFFHNLLYLVHGMGTVSTMMFTLLLPSVVFFQLLSMQWAKLSPVVRVHFQRCYLYG